MRGQEKVEGDGRIENLTARVTEERLTEGGAGIAKRQRTFAERPKRRLHQGDIEHHVPRQALANVANTPIHTHTDRVRERGIDGRDRWHLHQRQRAVIGAAG